MRVFPNVTVDTEFQTLDRLDYTGSLNDKQYSYLSDRGHTGALPDMFKYYREDSANLWLDFGNELYLKDLNLFNFEDIITFTRASTGTYLDSDGLLKTASTNVPRIEYDASGNRKGLLIEEARTNLVTHSVVSTANWSGVSVTTEQLSNNYLGVFSGVRVASTGATWNRLRSAQTISVSSGTAYTLTAWFVAGTSGRARIVLRDNTNFTETRVIGPIGALGINAETFGSLTNLIQETIGNIHKVSFTVTANATVSNASVEIGPETVNAGQDIILLGAQVEAGSFPTSYIPTSGSTATRSADVASIPTSAFGYNQKAGTVVVEAESFGIVSGRTNRFACLNNGGGGERINLFIETNSNLGFIVSDNSVTQGTIFSSAASNGALFKVAGAYSLNDLAMSGNGLAPTLDTSATLPTIVQMQIGNEFGSNLLNGHIKSIQYFPRRLTDSQLQRLTT